MVERRSCGRRLPPPEGARAAARRNSPSGKRTTETFQPANSPDGAKTGRAPPCGPRPLSARRRAPGNVFYTLGWPAPDAPPRILDPTMQHTVSHLKSPRQEVRLSAIKDLGRAAFDPQVVKHLGELLRDPDPAKRVGTVQALGQVGGEARPQAVALLAEALAQPDAAVRREAATSLGKIGPAAGAAAGALTKALKDADAKVRIAAATALGQIGPAAA